jgi:pimeloyl-ACP methyl ester carboxylesterase
MTLSAAPRQGVRPMKSAPCRPYRLFLHGLGDHPRTWTSVRHLLGRTWRSEALDLYDMSLRRSAAKDPLQALCERLADRYRHHVPHTIIGHSFGGVLVTSLARTLGVHCVLNIEGNLTPDDCTISHRVVRTAEAHELVDVLRELDCPDRYIKAASRSDFKMLQADARDLIAASAGPALEAWKSLLPDGRYVCGGSMSPATRRLLAGSAQPVTYSTTSSHWVQERPQP